MNIIYDYSLTELKDLMEKAGYPAYRAKQIFSGLYGGKKTEEITELPKTLISYISENFITTPVNIVNTQKSSDGTEKFLFSLNDGNLVEGVLMKYSYGNTLCISTQAGCAMGCAFCASTIGGLKRSLTAGEMAGQVLTVNSLYGGNKDKRYITNIVLMGSGEPLDNFENTVKFIRLISDKDGINISQRNISVSTCGIVPKIYELAKLKLGITLSLSLHSPFDEKRREIMPIARKYTVRETIDAVKYYFEQTGRRIIIEYSLIEGENCSDSEAKELKKLLCDLTCHINLIMLNPVKERSLLPCGREKAEEFRNMLEGEGLSVTIRRQTGIDIDGACGQLRRKYVE